MARDFNGTTDRATFTLKAFQTSLTQISISSWLYPDNTGQYRRYFEMGTAGAGDRIRDEFDDSWGWVFVFPWSSSSPGGGGKWSTAKPSTGAWINRVISYDSSSASNDPAIWHNGSSQSITERSTPSSGPGTSGTAGVLGDTTSADQKWDGRIAEFAVWNRALSGGEAVALGKGYSPLFFPRGLVIYYPLIGKTSPEIELAGASNATLTGTSAIAHPRIIYPSPSLIRMFEAEGGAPALVDKDLMMFFGMR